MLAFYPRQVPVSPEYHYILDTPPLEKSDSSHENTKGPFNATSYGPRKSTGDLVITYEGGAVPKVVPWGRGINLQTV